MPYMHQANSRAGYFAGDSTCRCRQCSEQLSGFGQDPTNFPPDQVSDDKFINEELKRGTSVKDITNEIFWRAHPDIRGFRLPKDCHALKQLHQDWKRIQARVNVRNMEIWKKF